MIEPIANWSFEVNGDEVTLRPTTALSSARIRYAERRRPLAAIPDLVARSCADVRLEVRDVGAPEHLVTREGENAAIVRVRGEYLGVSLELFLGYVLGDDFYSELIGFAQEAARRALVADTVKELVLSDVHMLGLRRRRASYTPPAGWCAAPLGTLFTTLHTPAVSGARVELVITPACPAPGDPQSMFPVVLAAQACAAFGERVVDVRGPVEAPVHAGFTGGVYELRIERGGALSWVRLLALLHDGPYLHTPRLDAAPAPAPEHRAAFLAVVRSLHPIPRAWQPTTVGAAVAAGACSFWAA